MASVAKTKAFVKRVVGHPEVEVPVITSKDWVSNIRVDPRRDVCILLPSLPSFLYRRYF